MRLVNGLPAETLALSDRAFQFGDGVFRTMRLQDGKLAFWQRHYRKLSNDCAALNIQVPAESVLLEDIRYLLQHVAISSATIKLVVTRGESSRGYAFPQDIRPNRIVQCTPLPGYADELYRKGAMVRLCQMRASWQPALAGIKHLNRLENVLARMEWDDPAIVDGIMLDHEECVVEGVMSNLLFGRDGYLWTPLLDICGVAGVMREVVIDAARHLGWYVHEQKLTLSDLYAAEQVWLSNSLMGLMPVRQLAQHNWRVAPDSVLASKVKQMAQGESQCVS